MDEELCETAFVLEQCGIPLDLIGVAAQTIINKYVLIKASGGTFPVNVETHLHRFAGRSRSFLQRGRLFPVEPTHDALDLVVDALSQAPLYPTAVEVVVDGMVAENDWILMLSGSGVSIYTRPASSTFAGYEVVSP